MGFGSEVGGVSGFGGAVDFLGVDWVVWIDWRGLTVVWIGDAVDVAAVEAFVLGARLVVVEFDEHVASVAVELDHVGSGVWFCIIGNVWLWFALLQDTTARRGMGSNLSLSENLLKKTQAGRLCHGVLCLKRAGSPFYREMFSQLKATRSSCGGLVRCRRRVGG